MRGFALCAVLALLSGCAPATVRLPALSAVKGPPAYASPEALLTFSQVVDRVEPIAERLCRERTRGVPCDIQMVVDDRPGMPPNAFQTLDSLGRPVVGFTLALINDARNADELAFVMGHESAHHILGHIARQQQVATAGAMRAGLQAAVQGADEATIRTVQSMAAEVAARVYSKDYELEADVLGTEIAYLAGYDPVAGAAFFMRLPDPGDEFLGTHPPNAQRIALVRRTLAQLRGGR